MGVDLDSLHLGQQVIAHFVPVETHNLRPEAAVRIGVTDLFYYGGVIEVGQYAGLHRFETRRTWGASTWLPSCDLHDIELACESQNKHIGGYWT